jgi:transcription antitermination factor NusG
MDFFQFLQKSTESSEQIKTNQKTNTFIEKKSTEEESIQEKDQETTVYKNIKKGDFVKIIYMKNSILNTYKGYIGEIKEYRKDMDSAVIFLHCITSFTSIRFPIEHFVKIK